MRLFQAKMVTVHCSSLPQPLRGLRVLMSYATCFLLLAGCISDMPQVPKNADPNERQALAAILPLAENASWNESGRLSSIALRGDAVTDEQLKQLGVFSDLEELSLIGARITDNGLARLKGLPRLAAVGVAWTDIGDQGIEHLSEIESLKLLDLNHTKITDASFENLLKLRQLSTLFIEGTAVSESAVQAFKRKRPDCRVQK